MSTINTKKYVIAENVKDGNTAFFAFADDTAGHAFAIALDSALNGDTMSDIWVREEDSLSDYFSEEYYGVLAVPASEHITACITICTTDNKRIGLVPIVNAITGKEAAARLNEAFMRTDFRARA